MGGDVVLGAPGDRLFASGGEEEGLGFETARALSELLVSRSVVGLTLRAPLLPRDVDLFLGCLAETATRLRAAGGVGRVLAERGVHSLAVTEIDFDKLLAGEKVDHGGVHPLIARAMKEALVLKGGVNPRGAAIQLAVDEVSTPDTLGSLLDELIDGAAPGVAEQPGPGTGGATPSALSGMSARELAEACTKGYKKLATGAAGDPQALAEAANVLSAALVRLSPQARFRMLQQIAEQTDAQASGAVGRAVPNPLLLSAISQVVMGGGRDSKLAAAIGNLLERLRPLEQDRQKFIEELDQHTSERGRPLERLFLQDIGEMSNMSTLGSLSLPFRETRPGLVQAARLRMASQRQPDLVARTFSSLRPENRRERLVRLYCAVLSGRQALGNDMLAAIRGMFATSAVDPVVITSSSELVRALWDRAIGDGPSSPAAGLLCEVVASETGPDWCIALLRQLGGRPGHDLAMLLFETLKAAVAAHPAESFLKRLTDALDEIDPTVMRAIDRRIAELPPAGVYVLLCRTGRQAPSAALSLARVALRDTPVPVRQTVLRALGQFPNPAMLDFLSKAAGLHGEPMARTALHAQVMPADALAALQAVATEALGVSRSPEAVPFLVALLNLWGEAPGHPGCRLAARALEINNSAEAHLALSAGRRSRLRQVRLACGAQA